MSGSIRKRKSSWQFTYMYKGNKYYGKASFEEAPTEKKAKELLEEFCRDIRKGDFSNTSNYTFEDIAKLWLTQIAMPNYSPIVVTNYVRNLNNHILPYFGDYNIAQITPLDINSFVNTLQSKQTMFQNRLNKPLSNRTIDKLYKITHTIVKYAYTTDIINSDPFSKAPLKLKKEVKEDDKHYYTIQEYKLLQKELKKEPVEKQLIVELAVQTGLRRSEIFGLKWKDIDLKDKTININKTRQKINGTMQVLPTKTGSSSRIISMPPSMVELFRSYKNNNEFIFNNVDYDCFTSWFRYWQQRHGLPRIKFHDLRHTHATLLLQKGVDVKTIQKRLGPSDISTTLNIYADSVKELDQKAAAIFDKI